MLTPLPRAHVDPHTDTGGGGGEGVEDGGVHAGHGARGEGLVPVQEHVLALGHKGKLFSI